MFVVFKSYVKKKRERYDSFISTSGCITSHCISSAVLSYNPSVYGFYDDPAYDDNRPKHSQSHIQIPRTKAFEEETK